MHLVQKKTETFTYQISDAQYHGLELRSRRARQTVYYNCKNSNPDGAKFVGDDDSDIETINNIFRRRNFVRVTNNCSNKNGEWSQARFDIEAPAYRLPVRDMLLYDVGGEDQEFSIQTGQVCFWNDPTA